MTIYRILSPEFTAVTQWHTAKSEAWKEAKRKTLKKKDQLKELGYKSEKHTEELQDMGSEQMMLMGR